MNAILQPESGTAQFEGAPLHVPRATYRLQFNRDFGFIQAAQLVAYLHELGISHCYASPFLRARPGSAHGYDVVDHGTLNPEIGSRAEFDRFSAELKRHGMGLLFDVVPNHMGVMGSDNAWWLDVLENGQASAFAGFFDIDWGPLKDELRGKVLLPVLGDRYGRVLERGELTLRFDAQRGAFGVEYFDHRFPIDPRRYPRILAHRAASLAALFPAGDAQLAEYRELISAFGHLPATTQTAPARVAQRNRDIGILKRHLAWICERSSVIARFVEGNVAAINGRAGAPAGFDTLHRILEAQPYRLAHWRVASEEINYRRFFDINELAALRMEQPEVFEQTHRLLFELVSGGHVDGLRIDHPDGLYDPGEYFERLQARCAALQGDPGAQPADAERAVRRMYLVIEKILAEFERLPERWPVHGTTGYRFANIVNGVFVDTDAAARMERVYSAFIGERIDFDELVCGCKKRVMRTALAGELAVLANRLSRIAQGDRHTRDFTVNALRHALMEVVACFPVYRSYVTPAGASAEDRRYIDWAVAVARKKSRDVDASVFDFVRGVLTLSIADGKSADYRDRVTAFAMRIQQFTAPVMAKSVEDSAFYVYNRLTSLNEVGGDPRTFGFSLAAFHAASEDRAANWPWTLINTSTHDTKRSEDARARINVLSEMPAVWKLSLRRWSRFNRSKRHMLNGVAAPSRNDEYLLYQTLLGVWPQPAPGQRELDDLRKRIERYMLKAVREASRLSNWINPNQDYEQALSQFIAALLRPSPRNAFLADFQPLAQRVARFGLFNSLSQTLIKLMASGVPDIYQGSELWQFNLVDPDNRRPVDYARRRRMLCELRDAFDLADEQVARLASRLTSQMEDGRIKLYLTWRALQLRARRQDLFQNGDYVPLIATGALANHVIAFARRHRSACVVVVAPRLLAKLVDDPQRLPLPATAWADTAVALPWLPPQVCLHNVLTGKMVPLIPGNPEPRLSIGVAIGDFPVALLECGT